jgi:hypothetical protein
MCSKYLRILSLWPSRVAQSDSVWRASSDGGDTGLTATLIFAEEASDTNEKRSH